MPSIEELDVKFAELVEELDLTAPNKAAMLDLPPQKKWQIYCSRKSPIDSTDGATVSRVPPSPEHYIERLKDVATVSAPNHQSIISRITFHIRFLFGSNCKQNPMNLRVTSIISKLNRKRLFWMH